MQKTAHPWPQHVTPKIRKKMKRCGKPSCRCNQGELHGPYWYAYWTQEGKKVSKYYGAALPPELARLVATEPPAPDVVERIERLRGAYASNPNIAHGHVEMVLSLLEDLRKAFLVPLELAEKEAKSAGSHTRLISPTKLREQALREIDPRG